MNKRSHSMKYSKFSTENTKLIMQVIRHYILVRDTSGPKLAATIGLTGQSLCNWARGTSRLNMHVLQLMADALDISPGEIVREAMR